MNECYSFLSIDNIYNTFFSAIGTHVDLKALVGQIIFLFPSVADWCRAIQMGKE